MDNGNEGDSKVITETIDIFGFSDLCYCHGTSRAVNIWSNPIENPIDHTYLPILVGLA